jgi:hypothetical protein
MEFSPRMIGAMGISFAIPITVAGLIYVVTKTPLVQWLPGQSSSSRLEVAKVCQTLTADPKPPLNVRSSPEAAADNVISRIPNGTLLSVIDESEGWLQISSPVSGWVFQELTITTCVNPRDATSQTLLLPQQAGADRGAYLMAIATQQYHAGNLKGAVALAKTVNPSSPVYPIARVAAVQWPQEWNRAESRYYTAQKALRDSRLQDAILVAKEFPDIRFWKEKITPIVKQAIEQSQPARVPSTPPQ